MRYFFFSITFFIFYHSQAQLVNLTERETSKKGVHYRFSEFKDGEVIMKNGDPVHAKINYNLVTEEMVVDLGHSKIAYQINEKVKKISIEDVDFIPVEGIIYERLLKGAVSLFIHRKKKLERTGQQTGIDATGTINSKDITPFKDILYELTLPGNYELRDVSTYFLMKEETLIPFTKIKNLNSVFPTLANELKSFIKKENIKMRNEEDLIKVVQFCNTNS